MRRVDSEYGKTSNSMPGAKRVFSEKLRNVCELTDPSAPSDQCCVRLFTTMPRAPGSRETLRSVFLPSTTSVLARLLALASGDVRQASVVGVAENDPRTARPWDDSSPLKFPPVLIR